MWKISRDNREEIEDEFMALMLNRNELFDITQVSSKYLINPSNAKIFEYCKECYTEYKVINPVKIYEKHKDVDFNKMGELLNETFYFDGLWNEQLKLAEESIVNFYKEDIINFMNKKLEKKEIDYETFMKKMKELDDIQLIKGSTTLSVEELNENINTENVEIKLQNFKKLNNFLRLVQGDFVIIGATTGAGKSGFMLNLMNDLMNRYQCIYFNMEMSKSTIYKRLISIKADVPIDDILSPKSDYQLNNINVAKQEIENAKIIVEHKANDIKQIKNIIMKYKDKNRHTVLFVDHLGLTRADNTKSLYEQATEVAKQLRQICLEYDCTTISASQLNRGAYQSDELSLSMLKDSGELENSASKVILLYKKNKEDKKSNMIINIAKNRDGIQDVNIEMEYDRQKQIFKEVIIYDN